MYVVCCIGRTTLGPTKAPGSGLVFTHLPPQVFGIETTQAWQTNAPCQDARVAPAQAPERKGIRLALFNRIAPHILSCEGESLWPRSPATAPSTKKTQRRSLNREAGRPVDWPQTAFLPETKCASTRCAMVLARLIVLPTCTLPRRMFRIPRLSGLGLSASPVARAHWRIRARLSHQT